VIISSEHIVIESEQIGHFIINYCQLKMTM
jgi:hypothetical protein